MSLSAGCSDRSGSLADASSNEVEVDLTPSSSLTATDNQGPSQGLILGRGIFQ